jgi:hypothetical protein
MKKKQRKTSVTEEMTKRGAAGAARKTAGMSRIVGPNKKAYNRTVKIPQKEGDGANV